MNDWKKIRQTLRVSLITICCAAIAQASVAQDPQPQSRADALRREREEKQKNLTPNTPDVIQRTMTRVERSAATLGIREGLQPWFGTIGRGSGIALGALYRDRDLFNRYGTLEAWSGYSIREYWGGGVNAMFPALADGRLTVQAGANVREDPRQDFFGLGPNSSREDRTNVLIRTTEVGGVAGVRVAPLLTVGGGMAWIQPRLGRGRASSRPAIEQRFSPLEAPGLGIQTEFAKTSAFVDFDYREPKNARKGGWYRLDISRFNDLDSNLLGFTRADLDLRQYFGFLNGRRVIALRGLVSTTDAADGQSVPFYMTPTLGGSRDLRGYRRFRFRGNHLLLLQAEYRWEIWSALEGALFYDAGKVTMDRSDLDLSNLETDYGFGFRFNTNAGVVLRFDTGFGREGAKFRISFGGPF